jgi:hypothetical protein
METHAAFRAPEHAMFNTKPTLLKAAAIFALVLVLSSSRCSAPQQMQGHEVKFIVIGNTSPASPFTGYPEKLEYVFRNITQDNPVLVIHTGNIVQGGTESVGIMKKDITRQYRKFLEQKKVLHPILHIMAGERDLYNGTLSLFEQYTGEKLFYSFNYGSIHFILLHILNRDSPLSPDQIKWLERDLEEHRYDAAIFVFSHYPVLSSPQSGIRFTGGEELHRLFTKYPVRAVLSGSTRNLYEYDKDGIHYAALGCFGFNYEDWHWSYNQYYVVSYDGAKLAVRGVRVNFPGNTYRPRILQEEPEKKN